MTGKDYLDFLSALSKEQLNYKVTHFGDDGVYMESDLRFVTVQDEDKLILFNTEVDQDLMDDED